jgi:hypothetical protein
MAGSRVCHPPHPWRVSSVPLEDVRENDHRGAMIRDWNGSRRARRSGRARSIGRESKLPPDCRARKILLSTCTPVCRDFRARRRFSCNEFVGDMQRSEMEVCGEPRIWHGLRRKVEMLTPATNTCSLGERTLDLRLFVVTRQLLCFRVSLSD